LSKEIIRCGWAGADDLYIKYHDKEWGAPLHDDRRLFELLVLEGAQAGLSWSIILRKRDAYRKAFDNFTPERIARYTQAKVSNLLADASIVRNRAKIGAAISNAQAFLKVKEEFESFDAYIWQFVDGKPIINRWKRRGQIPAETEESRVMSKDLKARGFRFVGPTICYAFMQAVGMINDHVTDCYRYREVQRLK